MARIFTATTYDGALLLADLRQVRPDLAASATAVDKTLANYEHHLSIYTEASLAAPSTRLRSASVCPLKEGARVFVREENKETEETTWWSGAVKSVQVDRVSVVLDGADSDGEFDTLIVPAADVRPDAAFEQPRTHLQQLDAEEDKDDTAGSYAELMAALAQKAKQLALDGTSLTFLDALLEVGEYTALVEVIFGHEDHFGTSVGKLIENKMAPLGPARGRRGATGCARHPALQSVHDHQLAGRCRVA
jgi:hypothetical protein